MSKTVYKLKVDIAEFPAGSVAVYEDEWNEWQIGNKTFDLRGNVRSGELVLLLNYAVKEKLTSIVENVT